MILWHKNTRARNLDLLMVNAPLGGLTATADMVSPSGLTRVMYFASDRVLPSSPQELPLGVLRSD